MYNARCKGDVYYEQNQENHRFDIVEGDGIFYPSFDNKLLGFGL